MPCFIVLAVLLFPRVVLVLLFLFSNYLSAAYQSLLVPLLGFLFLPITTLTYAWLVNAALPLEGWNLFLLVLAVIFDVGSWGGGAWGRRRDR